MVASLVLPGCGDFLDTAAAIVDDRKIDEDRFVQQLEFLLADPSLAAQLPAGEQGVTRRKDLTRQYLTFLIHQQVVREYAEARGIGVTEQEVDALLEQRIAQLGGRAAFDRQLRRSGTSEEEVRQLFEEELLRDRVADAVAAERLSEDSLRQAYDQRLPEFSQIQVAHILVASPEAAARIARQATPENFADLARRFSRDPGSARNGGALGTQRAADLVEPFARAALRIPIGGIGGPVQTDFGFHVIYVKGRQVAPFEEVRPQLVEELRGQVFTEWLVERIRDAEIRVNPRYGYFDEQTGSVLERRSTTPIPQPSVQLSP